MKNACQRVLSYKLSTYKSLAFYFGSAGFGTENLTWIFDLSHLLWPPGVTTGCYSSRATCTFTTVSAQMQLSNLLNASSWVRVELSTLSLIFGIAFHKYVLSIRKHF